ncbi:MAG: deoxynucleoside kinase [Clostridia bacterium]|nr:deoxynucleoside kinase [Clostridia bacterium]
MANTLIVIEGLDGSGKSTQIELLKQRFTEDGVSVRQIKLPDYEDKSSTLVKMYLGGEFGKNPDDVNIYAASSFYAVDRFASYKRHWQEDYLFGTVILADRYTTSNAVHQSVKLPAQQWNTYLDWLTDYEYNKMGIPKPTCVIYLDMPVEISQRLMSKRYKGNEDKKDIHEANVEYLLKCRTAAMFAAEKFGWSVIKCSEDGEPLTIKEINNAIYKEVKRKIRSK